MGLVSCGGAAAPGPSRSPGISASPEPTGGRADVGGYELAYACQGEGDPTVILEAGLGAAGTSEFLSFIDQVSGGSRVCT